MSEHHRNKAKKKAYDAARHIVFREVKIARARAWALAHPERVKLRGRKHQLKQYGLTPEDYRDHLVGQAGRCLICGLVAPTTMHVDHDHATGRFRGLLCADCNRMLGLARDDARRLRKAAAYLETAA